MNTESRQPRTHKELRFGLFRGIHFEEVVDERRPDDRGIRRRELRRDDAGFLSALLLNPLVIVIIAIVVIALVISGVLFVVFATRTLLTLLFVGLGLYLLIKPKWLAGMGQTTRWGLPLGLMAFGIIFYLRWI